MCFLLILTYKQANLESLAAGPTSLEDYFQKGALLWHVNSSQISQTFKCSGTVFVNLAWYRRTKDVVPLFDPKVNLFENSLLKMLAQVLGCSETHIILYWCNLRAIVHGNCFPGHIGQISKTNWRAIDIAHFYFFSR